MECGDRGGAERERERWFEVIFFILSLSLRALPVSLSLPPSLTHSLTQERAYASYGFQPITHPM